MGNRITLAMLAQRVEQLEEELRVLKQEQADHVHEVEVMGVKYNEYRQTSIPL